MRLGFTSDAERIDADDTAMMDAGSRVDSTES